MRHRRPGPATTAGTATWLPHPSEGTRCRVCGWDLDEPGWGAAGPSYLICDCCGAQSGVDDVDPDAARTYRAAWVAHGCAWWCRRHRPVGWAWTEELRENVPTAFR